MMTSFLQRAQRVVRLRNPFRSVGLILLYHRINHLPSDPQLLAVTPQHFAEHLQVLCKYAYPLRLTELANTLRVRKMPRRAVAITFDDGYADNLYNAKPLLERYEVPASVFVTTGHIGHQHEFWWDELERLLLQPGILPERLALDFDGTRYAWDIGAAAEYSERTAERHRGWNIEQPNDPSPRQVLYRALYHQLHSLSEPERQRAVDQLRTWAGVEAAGRPTHRVLSAAEISQLADGDLVEIGAHTVTHPSLACLPLPAQRAEIEQSKALLESILHRPVTTFAYPHGSYTPDTRTLLHQAGFLCACSSDTEAVWRGADPFQLPRVGVRDWDGDVFARWLNTWFGT